ncbi:MAG: hypothetical protein ACOYM2_12455 [Rectinemataceae bacterium]
METGITARTVSDAGRKAVCLENASVRTVICAQGGMMPEFGLKRGRGLLNAHWIPEWRANSGLPWSPAAHKDFWKAGLLYHLAGDFPCSPSFGGDCVVDGVALPAHGWAASSEWTLARVGVEDGVAFARFTLVSPDARMPLEYVKDDLVFPGQDAYYSVMTIRNTGAKPILINVGRHNTLGAPFLQTGCRISLPADRFLTAPHGTEFEATGRLRLGAEFTDLAHAPLAEGGTVDLSRVPGPIGYTDFVTGAIPRNLALGWSAVANPETGLAYVCFFPGLEGLPEGEIALGFNDLWLQYGGRPFTPWAMAEGAPDRTFCLGTENMTGAYAEGLAYSLGQRELLGRETVVEIPAGGERTLCYGAALLDIGAGLAVEGIKKVEAAPGRMVLSGVRTSCQFQVGADFGAARSFVRHLGR